MKHTLFKKKYLAAVPAVCLAFSVAAGVIALNAGASEWYPAYEDVRAEYTMNAAYNYFASEDFTQPYRTLVSHNRADAAYTAVIDDWQRSAFGVAEPTDTSGTRVAYDEAFLFDVLYDAYLPTQSMANADEFVKATQASVLKSISAAAGVDVQTYAAKNVSGMDAGERSSLARGCAALHGRAEQHPRGNRKP